SVHQKAPCRFFCFLVVCQIWSFLSSLSPFWVKVRCIEPKAPSPLLASPYPYFAAQRSFYLNGIARAPRLAQDAVNRVAGAREVLPLRLLSYQAPLLLISSSMRHVELIDHTGA